MKKINENILIIGGSGKNGSRVVRKLRKMGFNAISTTRKLTELKEDERYLDWGDINSYDEALKDIQRVYIVHPDTSIPVAYNQINTLVSRMAQLPIQKVVLLSGRGQESVRKCEEILMNSTLNWTIVRSAWFNQNFSEGHFLRGIVSGEVIFMADEVLEPFVDLEDLSDVVVEVLLNDVHNGKIYEVTGEELLSFKTVVETIGLHLKRDIKYTFLNKDDYKRLLYSVGMNDFVVGHMAEAFSEILDGRNANTGNGVQQVLGRKPKIFIEFVNSTTFK